MSDLLVFIYEPEQAEEVIAYSRSHPEAKIIAFDFWTEQVLKQKGIPFESSREYLPNEEEQNKLFEQAQTIAREWYRIPEMSFFEHKGVRIAEALEPVFDNYLQYVLFCRYVAGKTIAAHPDVKHVVVPYSRRKNITSGPLLSFQFNCLVDIAKHIASRHGFTVETIGLHVGADAGLKNERNPLRHRVVVAAINLFAAIQPKCSRKLLASEDWNHIKSFMEKMEDTEFVLTDKSEFRKMSWRALSKHRVRFLWPSAMVSDVARGAVSQKMVSFRELWKEARVAVSRLPFMHDREDSLWPVVEQAFNYVVTMYAQRVLLDVEGTETLLKREAIDTVLLRASVSAQYHFFVIAHVGHSLGIPSIEVQHAGAFLDLRSVHSRLEASYLAAYGPLTCKEHAKRYDERRLRSVGAPRFDRYFSIPRPEAIEKENRLREIGLDPALPVVLVVVPKEAEDLTLAPVHPSSYDVAALFDSLAAARAAIPDVQFIFKFKKNACSEHHRRRLRTLFAEGMYIISDADLFSMLLISDYVASHNSTALYEAMIAEKPIVQFAWRRDAAHDPIYGQIGPITRSTGELIAELKKVMSDPAYRQTCLERQRTFIDTNYCFDGLAYQRMLELLKEDLVAYPLSQKDLVAQAKAQ